MTEALVMQGRRWLLFHGDCMHPQTGLGELLDKCVPHVITDPPYEAEAHTMQRRIKTRGGGGEYGQTALAPVQFEAMKPELREAVAREIGRITQRWALVFCQVEAVPLWAASLTAGGMTYKRSCVWIKPDGQPQLTGDRPGMGYETIVTAHAPGRSRWNGGGRVGVYTAMRHQDHGPKHLKHPTVKPLPLMEQLIRDFTDPGDLIVDPFAGSGSTGVAAIKLGRRFIGWEVNEAYYQKALARLQETREQPEIMAVEQFEREAGQKRKQSSLDLDDPFTDDE